MREKSLQVNILVDGCDVDAVKCAHQMKPWRAVESVLHPTNTGKVFLVASTRVAFARHPAVGWLQD